MQAKGQRINCFQCKHFYTTWQKVHPRGCTGYGFKSKEMPSIVVLRSSGQACLKFMPKK